MFDLLPDRQRFQPPTEAQLWARREAKSDAMADELLKRCDLPSGEGRLTVETSIRRGAAIALAAAAGFLLGRLL